MNDNHIADEPDGDKQEMWKAAYGAEYKRVQRLEAILIRELGYDKAREAIAAPITPRADVPENVIAALDRMCTPLDESRLCGATAAADAYCMKVIRDYVLSAPRADTDTAGASDEQLDKLFFWMCTNYKTEGLSGFKAKARDLFAAGASNERADAELTPDRICQIAYMHSSDDDEPLFSFGHRELLEFVAAVRELSK